MSWWNTVLENLNEGDVLMTPGKGIPANGQKQFTIDSIEVDRVTVHSGDYNISLGRLCFDTLERAFANNPHLSLRVAAIKDIPPLPGSADELIRNATHSNLARGNYVCSILKHCGLVRYVMQGNRKYIALP
jgi:hypothetical protein